MEQFPHWLAAMICIVAVSGDVALAQTARTGGNASAQLVQQMQQLASERTALEAENEKLKSELVAVKKDRDALKAGQQSVATRARDVAAALAHSNAQHEATDQELAQTKAKMQELIAKFRETIQKLRETETESVTAKQSVATRDHELSVCVDRNVALYHLNDEVLTRLEERRGVFTRIAQAEPFTRIKRVQLENLVDDYRARAHDQLSVPPSGTTTRDAAAAGSPPSPAPGPAPTSH